MVEFQDAESWQPSKYGGKDQITAKGIMMDYLRKIGILSAQEFRGGFWHDNVSIINGVAVKQQVYVGDSREQFGNAVDWLYDFLFPYFDKKARFATAEVYKKLLALDLGDKAYKNKKVRLKRELFRELSIFLHRVDYLESEPFEDEEAYDDDDDDDDDQDEGDDPVSDVKSEKPIDAIEDEEANAENPKTT